MRVESAEGYGSAELAIDRGMAYDGDSELHAKRKSC